jgi:hypothetical protein
MLNLQKVKTKFNIDLHTVYIDFKRAIPFKKAPPGRYWCLITNQIFPLSAPSGGNFKMELPKAWLIREGVMLDEIWVW